MRFIDTTACLIYIENTSFFILGTLGSIKVNFNNNCKLFFNLSSSYLQLQSNMFYNAFVIYANLKHLSLHSTNFFLNLYTFFFFLNYGYRIKFKVIGLGHRAYYTKNLYLLKLGYSHLVYSILNIAIRSKKKKRKKQIYFKL